MKRALLVITFLSFSSVAFAQSEFDKAKKAFREAIVNMSAGDAESAAKAIAKSDNREAVDTLLDGYGICATMIKQLWVDKLKWMKEIEKYGNWEADWSKNPAIVKAGDVAEYQKWLAASKEAQEVERKIMSVEAVKSGIVMALGEFKSDAAVKELITKFKNDSSWQRRAGVAEALGRIKHSDGIASIIDRLKNDIEQGVKIACMDALRAAGTKSPEAVAAVAEQLKSDYWQVKATAAHTLKALGKDAKDAVEALIEAIKSSEGRLKGDINDALVAISGVDKHADYAAWKAWYESNKDAVKGGTYKPGAGEGANKGNDGGTTTFYGVPVKSKNVIFILDRSGSMAEPSEWEIPPDVATGSGAGNDLKPEGKRKIDIARWQLRRCIAQLPNGTDFNIVFFSHDWTIMSEKMITMSDSTRKQAQAFVEKLEPQGGTNIFDPLEKAFSFAGSADKVLKGSVDTIFLMTDGMPNSGQVPAADEIVKKIKEMNKTKKIVINTIGTFSTGGAGKGLGGGQSESELGAEFLEKLAKDSGGVFTSAMKKEPKK